MTRATKVLVALALIVSVLAPIAVGFSIYAFYTVQSQVDEVERLNRQNQDLIASADKFARRVEGFAITIQRERRRSVRDACRDTNDRYNRFAHALDTLAPSSRGRAATLFLISTIVPHRNCDRRVRDVVRQSKP